MEQNAEDIARMEMPCTCDCGSWFDLNDGHACGQCKKIYCDECLEQPFDTCEFCKLINSK